VDAIAGGSWLPQELEVIATPRSGSLITYSVGDLAPSAGGEQPGWDSTRPIAKLSPELESLCQSWLGAASGWSFALTTTAGTVVKTLADLSISAIEAVLGSIEHGEPDASADADGASTSSPTIRALLRAAPGATGLAGGETGTGRFAELAALAGQWRTRLADSSPLLLSNIAPTNGSGWELANTDDVAARLSTWFGTVCSARDALTAARTDAKNSDGAARDAAIAQVVTTLDALAAHGVRGSRCGGQPSDDAGLEVLLSQADAVLDQLGISVPKALQAVPASRTAATVQSWFALATEVVRVVVGDAMTLLPVLDLGDAVAALRADRRPSGADNAGVEDWIREIGRVRPATDELNTARLASEVLAGAAPPACVVSQTPGEAVQPWIAHSAAGDGGLNSPRVTCVLRGNAPATTKVCGIVFDSLTEVLPGRPRENQPPEEVAGIAFHIDRPDARAPQALLLAVPPNPQRPWRAEDLHTVVIETLELVKVRSLDLNDLPQLRSVVPLPFMEL